MFTSFKRYILLFGLVITPLLSFGDVSNLFTGENISQVANASGYIKVLKDVVFIFLILSGLFALLF